MIKLLPFEKFINHSIFKVNTGLCTNLMNVYNKSTLDLFTTYLSVMGFDISYPIGESDYIQREIVNDLRNIIITCAADQR